MKKNGIPEEQIIVMSTDDVANSSENPFPGQLFNKPDGEDVYAGCNIDYRGSEVTKKNFFAIMEGDAATAGGKVLAGDSNSKVFLNFVDHGAPGLIAMPTEYLYADELMTSFKNSEANGLFGEMVFYLEACESGSMFQDHLPTDTNIYALSAANASESSWGTYCYPSDTVNGKHINSCLGDLFSVNWMEDSDANSDMKESLLTQFNTVHTETTKSEVLQWGDMSFEDSSIGEFEADFATVSKMDRLFG